MIDGGAGFDTALYTIPRSQYKLTKTNFGWTVEDSSGIEGLDSLASVEGLKFVDANVAIDFDGSARSVTQGLRALLGKSALANKLYVGVGLQLVDAGMCYADLVNLVIDTPIFEAAAGGRLNTAFVNAVYRNVIGVAPSAGERAEYVGLLDSGALTQGQLAVIAAQHPLNTGSVDLVGLAASGVDFTPQG